MIAVDTNFLLRYLLGDLEKEDINIVQPSPSLPLAMWT